MMQGPIHIKLPVINNWSFEFSPVFSIYKPISNKCHIFQTWVCMWLVIFSNELFFKNNYFLFQLHIILRHWLWIHTAFSWNMAACSLVGRYQCFRGKSWSPSFIIIKQVLQCFYIFLRAFDNYIIFFPQLPLSFQSSSINPFSPISPLIPSAQVSLGLPHFLLPGGLHFITSFGNIPSSILWTCPYHWSCLVLISFAVIWF